MTISGTVLPNLRRSLAAEYNELSDQELDALVAEIYGPGVTAEDVEGLFDDIGRGLHSAAGAVGHFVQQAAPAVGKALPAIAQGALTGASVGGPIGAIVGAAAGGAGGILSQSKDPTLRGIGGAIGGVSQLASTFTGGGALSNLAKVGVGALSGGGGASITGALGSLAGVPGPLGKIAGTINQVAPIAAQIGSLGRGGSANALIGLLTRPETLQALSSAAMGQFGKPNVMVGNQPVAVQSILKALGNLSERAASEAVAVPAEGLPPYFYGESGELAVDPADSDQRTDALLALLALTAPRWAAPAPAAAPASDSEYTQAHALADRALIAQEWWENEEAA
jgi:hypothetical protein